MIIGVILAREGSKRIPGKNTKVFAGVPLVEWTLIEALKAKSLDRIIVSTDDPLVAKIAFKENVITAYRPFEYALDDTTSYETLNHVIDYFRLHQDIIVLLPPTSPLRVAADIDNAIGLAFQNADRTVLSVGNGETEGNGAIYIANASWISLGGNWDLPGPLKYEMPAKRSHDIDTFDDFNNAEAET